MKILIIGAGSIGVYLGTLLQSDGHEVSLFGRKKLASLGNMIEIDGVRRLLPKKLFELPIGESFDLIVISTKLYDLEESLRSLKEHAVSSPFLASIQNGLVDNTAFEEIIGGHLLVVSVFGGFNLEGEKLSVSSATRGWKVEDTAEGKRFSDLLLHAGVPCHTAQDFDAIRAEKTLINCSLNALSAIKQKTLDELFHDAEDEALISRLFDECFLVLSAYFSLEPREAVKKKMYDLCSNMPHYASMYQDVRTGRKTEIDFLNGYIVEMGRRKNIQTPENLKILESFSHLQHAHGG